MLSSLIVDFFNNLIKDSSNVLVLVSDNSINKLELFPNLEKYNILNINNLIDLTNCDYIIDLINNGNFNNDDHKEKIQLINNSGKIIISIGLNSGINSENGIAKNAIKSNYTLVDLCTPGCFLNDAKDYISNLLYNDNPFYFNNNVCDLVLKRNENTSKHDYGYVSIIGGSTNYVGAIELCNLSLTSMLCGAGVSRICSTKSIKKYILSNILVSTYFPLPSVFGHIKFSEKHFKKLLNSTTIAVGMGFTNNVDTRKTINYLLKNYFGNLIIDADGINALKNIGLEKLLENENTIITPHIYEFSRLINIDYDIVLNNPIKYAKDFAEKYKCILVLKGPSTIVASNSCLKIINCGNSGMATAGSGDVLSGVLAATVSNKYDNLFDKVCTGVLIHGLSGNMASLNINKVSLLSSDIIKYIPEVISNLIKK